MTPAILTTLTVLLVAVVLFVTGRLRVDVVALLVLVGLVVTGLVTPLEAFVGFSSPAVVTVWALLVLSAGLSGTGVIDGIGRQLLNLAGKGEVLLLAGVMATAVLLSAFLNNVVVAAVLLPIIVTLARQTQQPPSKLLLPLALGCLLGGLMTLMGGPVNLLVSDALVAAGLEPFQLFDFAPVGTAVVAASILFMILASRHLLPRRYPARELTGHSHDVEEAREFYGLAEGLALIILPPHSPLAGKRLADSRIGLALGMTILGVQRRGRKLMTIQPDTTLAEGDRLLALGRLDRLAELNQRPYFIVEESGRDATQLFSSETGLAELKLHRESTFIGRSIANLNIRRRYHFNVLAIRRGEETYRTKLQNMPLQVGDKLLLQGNRAELLAARLLPDFAGGLNVFVAEWETAVSYHIPERLLVIKIPPNSSLVGQSLKESQLGELFNLVALGISHEGQIQLAPSAERVLQAEDLLLVEGEPEELAVVRGLQSLKVKHPLQVERIELESDAVGLVEVVLSPHTTLVNKSLRDLNFRERYGLSVLAIWRDGRVSRADFGDMALRFGDALLLYGPREKINLLSREADFLVLGEELPEVPRHHKAPWAVLILLGVIGVTVMGWLPLAIAAVGGAVLMVLSGCLYMEEAYHQIEWRLIFLMAGLLPLGTVLETSGTAQFLAEGLAVVADWVGVQALLAGLFILASVAAQFVPNVAVTILLAPVALHTARALGLSPYALLMVVAIAASASLISPFAHPVNLLMMGPGGYRLRDYARVGVPLMLVMLLVTLLVLPWVWPLRP